MKSIVRRRQLRVTGAFLPVLLLLVLPGRFMMPGMAQTSDPAVNSAGSSDDVPGDNPSILSSPKGEVLVNHRKILEVTGETWTHALTRADRINQRLERVIGMEEPLQPFMPRDIVMSNGQSLITIGGEPILTVTPADGKENLVSVRELALMWGGKLSMAVFEARTAQANPLRGVGILVRYSIRDLVVSFARWLPRLAGAFCIWLVFWPLARFCRWGVSRAVSHIRLDPNLGQLARTVAFCGVWATGFIAILSTLGIDSASIAVAVGVSGFVLGFACKDILSHFFAGLMLLLGRQFHIGGQITVGEFEGTVERIDLRALQLKTSDNRVVTIPNGDVFTSAVIANTANVSRRREFKVGIAYETDIRRAQSLAWQTLQKIKGVHESPPPQVLVQELGGSAVILRILYHSDPRQPDWLELGSECIRKVKEAFEREGIVIPFEVRSIEFQGMSELINEVASQIETIFMPRNAITDAAAQARSGGTARNETASVIRATAPGVTARARNEKP